MGTTDNFNEDSPAKLTLALADSIPIMDSATSRAAYITGGIALSGLAGVVNTTATVLAITAALHANRIVTISSAASAAFTLPQATGTGNKYTFQVQVAATATTSTIKVANATDVMQGIAYCLITATPFAENFGTSATSDTITMDGTTLGGVPGDLYEITDVKTGFFSVKLFTAPTGTKATPFSATV